jgi:peptidoglycan hydrolase-like protein with peptidoglycan-binding domain
MTSTAVQRWQEFLKRRGFFNGKTSGIFGVQTRRATANYQAANGLTVNGIADQPTIAFARTQGFINMA